MTSRRRIARVRRRARIALIGQALWSAFWPGQAVIGIFLLLALSDALPLLDGWTHSAVLGLLALWLGWAVWRARKSLRLPRRVDADRQVERASGLRHRPLASLEDRPAMPGPAAQAIWTVHVERIAGQLGRLRAGWPAGVMPARDPWALRILTLVALAAAFAFVGCEADNRVARALTPSFPEERSAPVTVDIWIEPPAYTGWPTVFAGTDEAGFEVPEGSVVHARIAGARDGSVLVAGSERVPLEMSGAVAEGSAAIRAGGRVAIVSGEQELVGWPVTVLPDSPPSARFNALPRSTLRHALRLGYSGNDDYGIAQMRAEMEPVDGSAAEPLVLPLPVLGRPEAPEGSAYFDLTAHIWAGSEVTLQIAAVDGAGQEGTGPPVRVVLPERPFEHPVARAIVEARKALRWNDRGLDAARLDEIAAGEDLYDRDPTVTLALAVAAARLRRAEEAEPALSSVRSLLWKTALRLEDGGLALADRELRASQEAVMRAFERDASMEEIDRLIDALQRSLDRLLQELVEKAQEAGGAAETAPAEQGADRTVDRDRLQQMVERVRRLWEAGARDEARQLLAELQNMLENLRQAQMSEGQSERQAEMNRMLRELRELSRDQRRLLDRTFREGRPPPTGPQEGQQGQQQGQQGQQQGGAPQAGGGYPGLQEAQEQLRRRLGDYMRRLGSAMGQLPNELGQAEGSMRDASGSLGEGRHGDAVGAQGRALQNLQEAGQALIESYAREQGLQGDEPGGRSMFDPLGRRNGGSMPNSSDVELPSEGDFQRARHIRDELRRRVGDETRPVPERDYIERLLRRF